MSLPEKFHSYAPLIELFGKRLSYSIATDDKKNMIVFQYNVPDTDHVLTVSASPDKELQETLYSLGKPSPVGKGTKTEVDETVRKSRELDDVNSFSPEFMKHCSKQISSCLEQMGAGKLVSFKPHKVVMYNQDDFFSKHMDAVHTKGQNMTAVVVLNTNWYCGGLHVDGEKVGEDNYTDGLLTVVFDHDTPHEVKKTYGKGIRISITFDLVVEQEETKSEFTTDLISRLTKMGVERFGYFSTHTYFEDEVEDEDEDEDKENDILSKLKGCDKQVVNLLSPHVESVQALILTDGGCGWVLPEVWSIINNSPDGGQCMSETYDDDEQESTLSRLKTTIFPEKWEKDEDWLSDIIKDRYCLNDVFCLWSPYKPVCTMKGNEDIYLGNSGFSGKVHDCIFFLFTMKKADKNNSNTNKRASDPC